jgi:hypothetical protein
VAKDLDLTEVALREWVNRADLAASANSGDTLWSRHGMSCESYASA